MYQKAVVFLGTFGVVLSLVLGFYSVIIWQIVAALVTASVGIPSLILAYEKSKSHEGGNEGKVQSQIQIETPPIPKEESPISQHTPMRNETQITKLNVDNHFLDKIYEQARNKAIGIFPDAKLSSFSILVRPYGESSRVNVFLNFYSKWANKTCRFASYNNSPETEHLTPDEPASYPFETQVFTNQPWKESPQWQQFIEKAYAKIDPLTPENDSRYHLSARPHSNKSWLLTFVDGFSGRKRSFEWDGKGLDESGIKQITLDPYQSLDSRHSFRF